MISVSYTHLDVYKRQHVNFADEVTLGTALSRIMNVSRPANNEIELFGVDVPRIRRIIDSIPEDGYIEPVSYTHLI